MSSEAVGVVPVPTKGDRLRMALRHGGVGSGEMASYLESRELVGVAA